MREGPQEQRQAAAGQLAEIAGELKTLMQEVSLGQHGEAPIYGYVWLSMELAQQLEELGSAPGLHRRRARIRGQIMKAALWVLAAGAKWVR